MPNISDLIESFILESLGENESLDFSRSELADYFNCVPSQINYVLSTRFNVRSGFMIESQRGGSGFIRVVKLSFDKDGDFIKNMIVAIGDSISFYELKNSVTVLCENGYISEREMNIILTSLSSKSLSAPYRIEDKIRANSLKNILISLLKEERK